jgi:hypothetical protein
MYEQDSIAGTVQRDIIILKKNAFKPSGICRWRKDQQRAQSIRFFVHGTDYIEQQEIIDACFRKLGELEKLRGQRQERTNAPWLFTKLYATEATLSRDGVRSAYDTWKAKP